MNSAQATPLQFREDYFDVLTGELTRLREREAGGEVRLAVLSPPHPRSPFLTLAERRGSDELPTWVLKVLMLPYQDPEWRAILEEEKDRLEKEFRQRTAVGNTLALLRLPLTARRPGLVEIRALRALRWGELISGEPAGRGQHPVLEYMVRPFIPWPTLEDSGFSRELLEKKWEEHCKAERMLPLVKEDNGCRAHFYQEALVNEREEILLVSAWRWRRLGKGRA